MQKIAKAQFFFVRNILKRKGTKETRQFLAFLFPYSGEECVEVVFNLEGGRWID